MTQNKLENYSLIVASISGCLEAVRRGHADMGLIPHFGDEESLAGLSVEEIGQDRLMLVESEHPRRAVKLVQKKLVGPVMVYTPGTTYGARIAAMLERRGVTIQESPVCESASAEALLAQVKAGLGAAWIPDILARDAKVARCAAPDFFDVSYKILRIQPA